MMKTKFLFLALTYSTLVFSQVGVGTETPESTLDIKGKPDVATVADGLIAPRITRSELIAKTAYSADQTGTILYVADLTGTTNTVTSEVLAVGYYYFDGTKWKSFSTFNAQTASFAWSISNAYVQGTIVTHNNLLYQANATIPANTAFTIGTTGATWREISPAVQAWSSSNAYTANTLVSYGDLLYVANSAIAANAGFTVGLVGTGGTWRQVGIGEWRQGSIYAAGAAVYHNNTLYFANAAIPAGTSFNIGTSSTTWRQEGGNTVVIKGRFQVGNLADPINATGDIASVTRTSSSPFRYSVTFNKSWGGNTPVVSIGYESLSSPDITVTDNDLTIPVYKITGQDTLTIFIEGFGGTKNLALSVIVFPN